MNIVGKTSPLSMVSRSMVLLRTRVKKKTKEIFFDDFERIQGLPADANDQDPPQNVFNSIDI